jgi:hypothetical protein
MVRFQKQFDQRFILYLFSTSTRNYWESGRGIAFDVIETKNPEAVTTTDIIK